MMLTRQNRRRLAALLGVLAIALQAFWPLVARAKPADPALLVEVCTIDGITHYLQLPSGRTALEQHCDSQHEHCKLCVFGADRSVADSSRALPEIATASVPRISGADRETYARSLSRLPAQPRAPPQGL